MACSDLGSTYTHSDLICETGLKSSTRVSNSGATAITTGWVPTGTQGQLYLFSLLTGTGSARYIFLLAQDQQGTSSSWHRVSREYLLSGTRSAGNVFSLAHGQQGCLLSGSGSARVNYKSAGICIHDGEHPESSYIGEHRLPVSQASDSYLIWIIKLSHQVS